MSPSAPRISASRNAGLTESGTRLSTFLMRLIGVCVLPLVLLATWLIFDSVVSAQSTRDRDAAGRAKDFATAIDNHLNARIGALHMLAVSPLVDEPSRWKDLYREAQGFRDSFGSHVILAGVGEPAPMLFNTRLPFGAALPPLPRPRGHGAAPAAFATGKPAVGDTFPGPIAKETLVAIAVPALREGGTRFILLAIFETGLFQQRIEQVALPPDWALSLLDGRGEVIARRAPAGFVPAADGDVPGRFVVRSEVSPWSVVLEIPRDVYRAPLRAAATASVAALLVATLFAVLGGLLAGRRLNRSVASLTQPSTPDSAPPDIVEIAQARRLLDEASTRRDAAVALQQASEERLLATFELAAVGIAHVAPDGSWLNVNQKLCDIVGYTRDELLASRFQDITHPDDLDRDLDQVHQLLAAEIQAYSMEKRYLRKDGGIVWINLAVAMVRKDSGEPDYFISVIEDISKRKRLEQRDGEQLDLLTRNEAEGRRLLDLAERSRRALLTVLEDQQRAEAALRQSGQEVRAAYERFEKIFLGAPEAMSISDMGNGRLILVNDAFCETFGYAREALLGRSSLDLGLWTDPLRRAGITAALAEEHTVRGVEGQTRRASGELRDVLYSAEAIWLDGESRLLLMFNDITERKQAEVALRASEARVRSVFEQANDGIYIISAENRYLDANPRGFELLGYTRDELLQMSVADVLAPHEVARLAVEPPQVMSGIPHLAEWEHVRRDGSTFPGEISARQLDDHSYLAIVRDLSERKRMEEERRQIFERITDAFVALDKDWCYTFVNAKAALMFGRRAEDLIGKHIWTEFPEGLGQRFHLAYEKVMAEQQAVILEEYYPPYERWFENRVYPSPEGLTIYFHDITERKQAEADVRRLHEELQRHAAELEQRVIERTAQLEAAKIRAEAADLAKSTFLATMSHELRTPLNSIIGFTGVLQQKIPGPLNAEQEKQLGIVRNASRHLLELINDVLDISKVEAGELSLASERFDLRELLLRLGETFAPQAARRGLSYGQKVAEGDLFVSGDSRRVAQVLGNLIANALKFTPGGGITLDCTRRDEACIIAVSDTGVGIRPEDMDRLFRPFSQIENGLTGLREGTGLGLAISRHLAQAMGATIQVESEWGKGSRFSFTLPMGGKV